VRDTDCLARTGNCGFRIHNEKLKE